MNHEEGDRVQYAAQGGSIGTVEGKRTDGPFARRPVYFVRWNYGLDARGEPVIGISGNLDGDDLAPISEERFLLHTQRRFNSGGCPCGCMDYPPRARAPEYILRGVNAAITGSRVGCAYDPTWRRVWNDPEAAGTFRSTRLVLA